MEVQTPPANKAMQRVTFRPSYWVVSALVFASLIWLVYYHWGQLGIPILRIPVIIVSFIWMSVILVTAHFNRPATGTAPKLKVMTVVPNHNEDPAMFLEMLRSMERQTLPPYVLYIVENGGTNGKCRKVFDDWNADQVKIPFAVMGYEAQQSKRGAQGHALRGGYVNLCDILNTVDGDTELLPNAIEEGLKPFNDPQVMSVAGLLIGKNDRRNLLTRLVNLGFVSSFMNGRAAWSTFGAVGVNCGGLAFYRMHVVLQHLDEYLTQTVLGREVNSGDDRIMTAFAALHGKTTFQETSVAYTLLPYRTGHLGRQRARWWRSFWWGGVWLLRRLPATRPVWWLVLSQYITFVLYALMLPIILLVDPIRTGHFPWEFFVYIAGLSYIRAARTLKVKRPDQSTASQVGTYLIASPFVTFLNLWVCAYMQWWGLVTFYVTGWRTRQTVEVSLEEVK